MTTKAHIQDNTQMRGINVLMFDKHDSGTTVWVPGSRHRMLARDGVQHGVEPMTLSDDDARALLTALVRHYEGGEDNRSLRRDYDAERKRVDTFIAHLTSTS